jgi:hypothetical protein
MAQGLLLFFIIFFACPCPSSKRWSLCSLALVKRVPYAAAALPLTSTCTPCVKPLCKQLARTPCYTTLTSVPHSFVPFLPMRCKRWFIVRAVLAIELIAHIVNFVCCIHVFTPEHTPLLVPAGCTSVCTHTCCITSLFHPVSRFKISLSLTLRATTHCSFAFYCYAAALQCTNPLHTHSPHSPTCSPVGIVQPCRMSRCTRR